MWITLPCRCTIPILSACCTKTGISARHRRRAYFPERLKPSNDKGLRDFIEHVVYSLKNDLTNSWKRTRVHSNVCSTFRGAPGQVFGKIATTDIFSCERETPAQKSQKIHLYLRLHLHTTPRTHVFQMHPGGILATDNAVLCRKSCRPVLHNRDSTTPQSQFYKYNAWYVVMFVLLY